MHSSELARMAGVSTDTLRYYERLRLLPAAPRSALGYRLFPAQALNRLRLIRGALAIGFSVRELAAIFAERDRGGAPCHRVRELAREKLATLERSLRELQIWRRELKTTLAGWDRLLGKTSRGQRAGLLESFVASHPTRQKRYSALMPLARGLQKREKSQLDHSSLWQFYALSFPSRRLRNRPLARATNQRILIPIARCTRCMRMLNPIPRR